MKEKKNVIKLKPENIKNVGIHVKQRTEFGLLMERNDGTAAELYDGDKTTKIDQRDKRTEEEKVPGKIHHTPDGGVGFPSAGFKDGMKGTIYSETNDGMMSMRFKEAVQFLDEMVPIKYNEMTVDIRGGKRSGPNRSPRKIIRPLFDGWSAILRIEYDADLISLVQLVNVVNKAGRRRGVGGYRPACNGKFGQYKVDKVATSEKTK